MRLLPAWIRSIGPLALADLRHRYAGSLLGAAWAVVGPLVEVAAYSVVFGLALGVSAGRGGAWEYVMFLASGLLPWSALREAIEGSAAVLPDNRWIRRSRVPMDLLVARHTLAASVRAAVGLLLVVALAGILRPGAGAAAFLLPPAALLLQALGAYGLGLAVAPLATLHPDLRPALASALTFLTFASPILYPEALPAGALRRVLEWNPFTHFLRFYRAPLAVGGGIGLDDLAIVVATPAVLLVAGACVRSRL